MTSDQPLGTLHHVALFVDDADSAATAYERAGNWRRVMSTTQEGEDARVGGAVLGLEGATALRIVMLSPAGAVGTQLEFVSVATESGQGHAGGYLLSFRVDDVRAAWEGLGHLIQAPVLGPTDTVVGGWALTVASFRAAGGELIELIQFR